MKKEKQKILKKACSRTNSEKVINQLKKYAIKNPQHKKTSQKLTQYLKFGMQRVPDMRSDPASRRRRDAERTNTLTTLKSQRTKKNPPEENILESICGRTEKLGSNINCSKFLHEFFTNGIDNITSLTDNIRNKIKISLVKAIDNKIKFRLWVGTKDVQVLQYDMSRPPKFVFEERLKDDLLIKNLHLSSQEADLLIKELKQAVKNHYKNTPTPREETRLELTEQQKKLDSKIQTLPSTAPVRDEAIVQVRTILETLKTKGIILSKDEKAEIFTDVINKLAGPIQSSTIDAAEQNPNIHKFREAVVSQSKLIFDYIKNNEGLLSTEEKAKIFEKLINDLSATKTATENKRSESYFKGGLLRKIDNVLEDVTLEHDKAATKIQKMTRKRAEKQRYDKKKTAIENVQAKVRQRAAKQIYDKKKSAIKNVQAKVRQRAAKKRVDILKTEKAKKRVDNLKTEKAIKSVQSKVRQRAAKKRVGELKTEQSRIDERDKKLSNIVEKAAAIDKRREDREDTKLLKQAEKLIMDVSTLPQSFWNKMKGITNDDSTGSLNRYLTEITEIHGKITSNINLDEKRKLLEELTNKVTEFFNEAINLAQKSTESQTQMKTVAKSLQTMLKSKDELIKAQQLLMAAMVVTEEKGKADTKKNDALITRLSRSERDLKEHRKQAQNSILQLRTSLNNQKQITARLNDGFTKAIAKQKRTIDILKLSSAKTLQNHKDELDRKVNEKVEEKLRVATAHINSLERYMEELRGKIAEKEQLATDIHNKAYEDLQNAENEKNIDTIRKKYLSVKLNRTQKTVEKLRILLQEAMKSALENREKLERQKNTARKLLIKAGDRRKIDADMIKILIDKSKKKEEKLSLAADLIAKLKKSSVFEAVRNHGSVRQITKERDHAREEGDKSLQQFNIALSNKMQLEDEHRKIQEALEKQIGTSSQENKKLISQLSKLRKNEDKVKREIETQTENFETLQKNNGSVNLQEILDSKNEMSSNIMALGAALGLAYLFNNNKTGGNNVSRVSNNNDIVRRFISQTDKLDKQINDIEAKLATNFGRKTKIRSY